jgi:5S rRNA maturation endonuclease (ribonuclease M5)
VNDTVTGEVLVKALEDALTDGMDVVTLSVGSPAQIGPLAHDCGSGGTGACDIFADAIENAARLGLVAVAPAGNDGAAGLNYPTLNTIHSPGTAPSAITVGASTNSHLFFAAVLSAGRRISALFGEGPKPNPPLKFRLDKLERDHPYLTERGLTQETIIDFGVGFCAKGMMAERIAIPIHNPEGNVVAYAGRWPGEPAEDTPKYKLPQGFRKSLELFNIDRASKEPAEMPLIIVEGFFDAMKLHQHGCRKVVALMGSTMSPAQEELIRRHTDRRGHVIVMLDEDEAGRAGREDIAVRLSRFVFVKVHTFEKDGEQPENLSAADVGFLLNP